MLLLLCEVMLTLLVCRIVLLQQVPILQNVQNRRETEKRNVGKYDIVYSYHSVIGTYGETAASCK